jgi:hypothetical protein
VVTPDMVGFKVKIYNRLERVLRLAGTVVSFQVAGKTADVPKARYENFLNGIILPRQEAEYEVGGPNLAALPDNATLAFLLYDIVTATDAAGNPTKRSNFEFFYTLSRQDKEQEASVGVSRVMLSQGAAQLLLQRDGGTPQWFRCPSLTLPGSPSPHQQRKRGYYAIRPRTNQRVSAHVRTGPAATTDSFASAADTTADDGRTGPLSPLRLYTVLWRQEAHRYGLGTHRLRHCEPVSEFLVDVHRHRIRHDFPHAGSDAHRLLRLQASR